MFLALCIVPWVTTADSDSRTWYSFFQIMTYPEHGAAEVSGWVIGLVVCAVVAAIVLVLLASQLTTVASGTRISAVVGSVLIAALGCNLAWGLVDAVMYLVRTVTDRGRSLTLVRSVRHAPNAYAGRALIARSLFSAVHGIVLIGLEEKLQSIPLATLREQAVLMVEAIARGLARETA